MDARLVRTVVAFLIAPVVPGLLAGAYGLVLRWQSGSGIDPNGVGFPVMIAAFFGYPVALLLGVPTHLSFQRLGWVSFLAYSLAGGGLGVLLFGFFFVPPALACALGAPADSHECLVLGTYASNLDVMVLSSAIAGGAFWFIARPDRTRRILHFTP
jgi:hypothetical protein